MRLFSTKAKLYTRLTTRRALSSVGKDNRFDITHRSHVVRGNSSHQEETNNSRAWKLQTGAFTRFDRSVSISVLWLLWLLLLLLLVDDSQGRACKPPCGDGGVTPRIYQMPCMFLLLEFLMFLLVLTAVATLYTCLPVPAKREDFEHVLTRAATQVRRWRVENRHAT